MRSSNSIKIQDMVHFLHHANGSNYPRPHGGKKYFFDNGSLRLFNGVMPESVNQRRADFSPYVAGCLCCVDKKCSGRDGLEVYAAIDHLFRAITLAPSRDVRPFGVSQSIGAAPKGYQAYAAMAFNGGR